MASKKASKPAVARKLLLKKIVPKMFLTDCNDAKIVALKASAQILGNCTGYEIVSGTFGDSVKFRGQFEMTLPSGVVAESPNLYLPTFGEELLRAKIDVEQGFADTEAGGKGKAAISVQFGFTMGCAENDKSKTGYEWTLAPLFDMSGDADDPLAAVRKLVADAGAA